MKNVLFFLLIFCANVVFAQKNVTGIITDKNGNTVSDVRVSVKNANNQTFTDNDGKYSIIVPEGYKTLEFSKKGFACRKLKFQAIL